VERGVPTRSERARPPSPRLRWPYKAISAHH